jgi:hypothetical protein
MRAFWILPNRDQGDVVLANDGRRTVPLKEILPPETRPDGFSHGVPTELLERCGVERREQILFAQRFPRWSGDEQLAAVFAPAGVDASGRVVHIGLLFLLAADERPDFDVPVTGLSADDRPHASALIRRMSALESRDPWVASVRELLELPGPSGPATNVELTRSVTPFEALYELHGGGLVKARRQLSPGYALVLSTFIAVLGACLFAFVERCEDVPKHGERILETSWSGAVTWHFS